MSLSQNQSDKNKTKKLLWVSYSPHNHNGYGRVIRELAVHLNKEYDFKVFGINSNNYKDLGYQIIDSYDANTGDYGFSKIITVINTWKPNYVVIHHDPFIVHQYALAIKNGVNKDLLKNLEIIGYLNIDSDNSVDNYLKVYKENLNQIWVDTQYALKQVNNINNIDNNENKTEIPITVLGRGFNQDNLRIIDTKKSREVLGLDPDAFIIFSGNRNQPRKRLDILLRGYVHFLKNYPSEKIVLLMNCGAIDLGWDIPRLFQRFALENGIKDWEKHIRLTTKQDGATMFDDSDLSLFYSASDIGVSTSMSESWGLVNFEHAGFGKPQIVPNCGALGELFNQGAIKINPSDYFIYPVSQRSNMGQGCVIGYKDFAKALEIYYTNKELREEYGKNAQEMVLKYNWKNVGDLIKKKLK